MYKLEAVFDVGMILSPKLLNVYLLAQWLHPIHKAYIVVIFFF
jgi:hypothetical protein